MLACKEGRHDAVQFLIQNGANLEAINTDGWTALHYATYFKSFECVELLVKSNANLHALTNARETPIHLAVENGFLKAFRLFVSSDFRSTASQMDHQMKIQTLEQKGKSPIQ